MRNIQKIVSLLLTGLTVLILTLSVKGNVGNPSGTDLNEKKWLENGPFEVSPERGRFALTHSLVEEKSVKFSLPVAKFVTPDLGFSNGDYVSLFAPGVSVVSIPGYVIGKLFNISQVGTFATIAFFALLNTLLIARIAQKLGADTLSAKITSLLFLFATPAFAYATTMYQHHISAFLILLSIYSLLNFRDFINLGLVTFLYVIGILIDYPNALIMLPILIFSVTKLLKREIVDRKYVKLSFDILKPIALLVAIPPLLFFLWFNKSSYGSPLQLSGTVPRVVEIVDDKPLFYSGSENRKITEEELDKLDDKSAIGFFDTRRIINGLNVLLLSRDRGILYYAPVLVLGMFGMIILGKKKNIAVFWAVSGVNLILYSMWGDPWGGWAFGSRYLIPLYAMVSIFFPFALKKMRKNYVLISITLILLVYSVAVNSVGALTSIANPPEAETQSLSAISGREEKFTFERNIDLLLDNNSKSFVYNTYFKDTIFVWEYYYAITVLILLAVVLSVSYVTLFQKQDVRFSRRN